MSAWRRTLWSQARRAVNSIGLRERMRAAADEAGLELHVPPMELCTDNAAMIACAGAYRLRRGERTPLDVAADPGLRLDAA